MSRAELRELRDPYIGVTAEYVVGHAQRQRARGKNPSLSFMEACNPREALLIAQGHVASAEIEDPENVLNIDHGSVLAWVRAQDPKRREEYIAVDKLSRSSIGVRAKFIQEMVQWYEATPSSIPQGQTSQYVIISNMMHVTSPYMLGNREPWVEAIEAVQASESTQV